VSERKPKLAENELKQWKLIADFRERLEEECTKEEQSAPWQDRRRRLEQWDYLSLFLFALINPALKSLRAISAGSGLERVQKEVCSRAVSLGSLSEAQHLAEPELLEKLIASLSAEIQGPAPANPHTDWQKWLARDSSIFPATARMFWAQHGAGKAGCHNHAVRFHASLHLWDDKPGKVAVTPGKVCERKAWREQLEPGATYVGDRYFAEDYKMFGQLEEQGCHFVLRLRDEAVWQVEEELAVSATEQQQQGVVKDAWGRLGCNARYRTARLRVVTVRKASGTLMRLVTNYAPEELSAGQILTLYHRRWQIECFFRWLKCLLGCGHWLAQSQRGVTIQLYLAVIAGLLLQVVLGKRPNQRLWECLQLYLMGWATREELLQRVNAELIKADAKKS
jgi:hypothetical protein